MKNNKKINKPSKEIIEKISHLVFLSQFFKTFFLTVKQNIKDEAKLVELIAYFKYQQKIGLPAEFVENKKTASFLQLLQDCKVDIEKQTGSEIPDFISLLKK